MRNVRSAGLAAIAALVTLAVAGCAPKVTAAVPAPLATEEPVVRTDATPTPTATPAAARTATALPAAAFKATPTPTPSGEATMDAAANAAAAAKKAAADKKTAGDRIAPANTDPRCGYGTVMCVSKAARKLYFMKDGQIVTTVDVRFGKESDPERRTREGNFLVFRKEVQWTSNLYGSEMPYAMFFSGGQAVHFSSDFAARGYNGNSHGCVNVRDKAALAAIFDQVEVGSTRVVVY
ncbi:L,D-transpeptidase [Raineyella sp. LH-20]|uniref:L,D-transpeptidase n=1 Tax=Raineyella sp. LH-20 TaxID=3081204 RepID=UPI002954A586|nr:L,D-transpeptidase [Raineyella sp. LH-20]WOP17758.1 L,D-transpeptidase [Raineyella sp. LH-20]